MIRLTRISGSGFVLNADLIERIDSVPDTVISLVDGKKYVVLESPERVMHAVRRMRSDILAMSCQGVTDPEAQDEVVTPAAPRLATVAPLTAER